MSLASPAVAGLPCGPYVAIPKDPTEQLGEPTAETVPEGAPSPRRKVHALEPGAAVGRYRIVEPLGRGGMGVVYRAHDAELGRDVALKLVTAIAAEGDSQGRARLLREAQAMAQLAHPNVIHVYEVGRFEDNVFLAMELVNGERLDKWMKQPRPLREVVRVFREAGRGLAAAHAVGLVHRDFKPTNLMLGSDGRVRVLDFGLARAASLEPDARGDAVPTPVEPSSPSGATLLSTPVTQMGAVVGTPPYMAPEQQEGRVGDERSDQFSFCVSFYQALYGERPFGGMTHAELVENICAGRVRPAPAGTRVPSRIRHILLRGLAVDPAARWPSMQALDDALAYDPALRWRRVGLGAAALSLLAVAALGWWRGPHAARACEGAAKQLDGVWDAARKGQVETAFRKTGLPYAGDAFLALQRALDGYAQGWMRMHTDACEATQVRREQSAELLDLRMACLSSRLDDLRAQVDVMAGADAQLIERASSAAQALRPLEACADATALRATVPPPADAQTRARVGALAKELASAKALDAAGRYPEARQKIDPAVKEAHAIGYRPVEAEALLELGKNQESSGDYPAAVRSLKDAGVAAESGRHDEVAALAAISLTWVTGERLGKFAEAHDLERDARAKIERLGKEERLIADLDAKIGAIDFAEGKYDEARTMARTALALREKLLAPDDPLLASSLGDLADIAMQQARYDEALAAYRRAIAIAEKALGPEHPQVASLHTNLATGLRYQAHYDEALAEYHRALAIDEKALGSKHPELATIYVNLGNVLRAQRKFAEAKDEYRRALTLWTNALGPEHPSTATALFYLGSVSIQEGRTDEALVDLQRVLAIWQKALGPEHPSLSAALVGIGDALLARGHAADALNRYQRANELVEKAVGPDHPDLADGLTGVGLAQIALHQPRKAVAPLERALAIRIKNPGDALDLARTRFALGRALVASGERKRGRDLLGQARDGYASNGRASREVAEIDRWLARSR
jgi:tetratricopeptide (TPR) repeat protein/predicted Ser/Thr protein kinase